MDLRTIMHRGPLAVLIAGLGLATGCTALDKQMTTANAPPQQLPVGHQSIPDARETSPFAPDNQGPPVASLSCLWQNRLNQLPDPTRNGTMTPGIVGQALIFPADIKQKLSRVNGELTVIVKDATQRAPGVSPATSEVWHFTAATLRTMVSIDERFGLNFVLFLPWPPEWRDVNSLTIQARYDQPGGTTVYSQPSNLNLDFTSPGGPTSTGGMVRATGAAGAVPDPRALVQQVRDGYSSPVQQAGGFLPAPAPQPQLTPQQWAAQQLQQPAAVPQPAAVQQPLPEFKRVVIPRQ